MRDRSGTARDEAENVMRLPPPRGPISSSLFDYMHEGPKAASSLIVRICDPSGALDDADFQIALWSLYELHYRSFDDIDERWEWDPTLLAVRSKLEDVFERALHHAVIDEVAKQSPQVQANARPRDGDLASRFFELVNEFDGPELAKRIQKDASAEQIREFLLHRSVYHLKEADPQTWSIPRLTGPAKSALVELQFDEYGDGVAGQTHAELFAITLREAGLDSTYGAYIDEVNASTLAVNNVMSLFGLHRRNRGAAMGHLAAFEATSSLPCRRYAAGLRRAGFSEAAAHYFDEHTEADAVHEQLAVRAICVGLIDEEPQLEADILFGALCCLVLDARQAVELIASWDFPDHRALPIQTQNAVGAK